MKSKESMKNYESIIISYCLKDMEYYHKCVTDGLTSDQFQEPMFKEIFKNFELNALTQGITPLIVSDNFNHQSIEEKEAFISNLQSLKDQEIPIEDYQHSLKQIKEYASHRALQGISALINQNVEDNMDSSEIVSTIMTKIFSLGQQNDNIQEFDSESALKETGKEITNRLEGDVTDGVPSGIETLDKEIKCFYYGLYSLIIARPGHCKTTLMINAFVNNIKAGYKPVFVSLEMPAVHLMIKILSIWTKIPVSSIMNPKVLSTEELTQVRNGLNELSAHQFYIVDAVSMTVTEASIILYKYAKLGCNSAYLDYFQLLKLPNGDMPGDAKDFMVISKLMRQHIKNVNRVGNMALVMGAQAGRDVEKRPIDERIPQMSDLQWSSSLEQDAAVVIGLMNRQKYEGENCEYPNQLFVGFPKHRYENAIRVNLAFLGSIQYITDLAHPERHESIPA